MTNLGQQFGIGDKHNFGLQTTCYPEKGYAIKPRTVMWEELFFSKNGVIPLIFEDNKVISCLTQYEVLEADVHQAKVKLLQSNYNLKLNMEELLNCYAALTVLSSTFGISDLIMENIVMTEFGPCPIDVELVFHPIAYPTSSLLIPPRHISWQWTGIAHISNLLEKVTVENLNGFLQSIEDYFLSLIDKKESINTFFLEKDSVIKSAPIKFLMRQSRDYMRYLEGDKNVLKDPLPEELEQLRRGDIPYFFSYLGKKELFYYHKPHEVKAICFDYENPGSFFSYIPPQNVNELMDSSRITELLLPLAMLEYVELFSKFNPELEGKIYKTKKCEISFSEDGLEFHSPFSRGIFVYNLINEEGLPLADRRFNTANDYEIPSTLDPRMSHRVRNQFFRFP
jgi:hypothetical protein